MKHTQDCIETCKRVLPLLLEKDYEQAIKLLSNGFGWASQPEGYQYWRLVIHRLINEQYQ